MTIQKVLLLTLVLSASAFATDRQAEKSPSELKWSSSEDHCIGEVCVKVNDADNTANMFERKDKFEQQDLKDPPAFRNSDSNSANDHKTLHFSFGDDK